MLAGAGLRGYTIYVSEPWVVRLYKWLGLNSYD